MRAGAVPVGAYDRAVGHRVFAAGGGRQVNEQALPHACFEPTAEPGVDVLPRRRPRMRTCPDILPGPSDRGGSIVANTVGGFERPERRLAVVIGQTRRRLAAARVRSSVRPSAWPAITCAAHPFGHGLAVFRQHFGLHRLGEDLLWSVMVARHHSYACVHTNALPLV